MSVVSEVGTVGTVGELVGGLGTVVVELLLLEGRGSGSMMR